ncbi:hypothetical protein H4R34_005973 [Dimargaris verticillata]|uniref:Uncharacterized protein n=1 Tax=Dimargaris verticillata TaxID=2761393 RepID=A0A9W8E9S4_9FUNG|nr:hypothetical protein H4R34_005973 [Dimargaris verticillata]
MNVETPRSVVPITLTRPMWVDLDAPPLRPVIDSSPPQSRCTSPLPMSLCKDSSDESSSDESSSDMVYQPIDAVADTDATIDTDTDTEADVESDALDEDPEPDHKTTLRSRRPDEAITPPSTPKITTSSSSAEPCKVRCMALAATCWQHHGSQTKDKQELAALIARSPFWPLISPKLPFKSIKDVADCISFWEKNCGYKADVLETFPHEKEESMCCNVCRVDRLAHIELKLYAAPVKDCQCGVKHVKWLALTVPTSSIVEITNGTARGWGLSRKTWKKTAVRAAIQKWFAHVGVISSEEPAGFEASETVKT